MSVFTPITTDEARAFVAPYNIGDIIDFQNIAAGVENSNFFVTTTQGRYVLTIFEKIPRQDLDFYLGLMSHLNIAGVRSAAGRHAMPARSRGNSGRDRSRFQGW